MQSNQNRSNQIDLIIFSELSVMTMANCQTVSTSLFENGLLKSLLTSLFPPGQRPSRAGGQREERFLYLCQKNQSLPL
jgi:hypothetical protein